jgi:hypothetical protein
MLRDPNGLIWSNTLLKSLFNEAQKELQQIINFHEDIVLIRVPAMYEKTHLFDWEWAFTDHAQGYVWRAGTYYDPYELTVMFRWESEHLSLTYADSDNATSSDLGAAITHPFESYMGSTTNELPSTWFPGRFDQAVFVAWDKEPLEPNIQKEISSEDPSHKTRWGEPQWYSRDEKLENHLILYPGPSDPGWLDIEDTADIDHFGMVLFTEDDTASSEYGVCVDIDDGIIGTSDDFGLCYDVLEPDDSLLIVCNLLPRNITGADDGASEYPSFVQKYLEYGVLERCFAAETDGKIETLRQYWAFRKDTGVKALEVFKTKRRADRDYLLRSHDLPARTTRRHPRLPDAYPAI